MSERLADVESRLQGMRELSTVVSAMRGVAAAHAQQARGALDAVHGYARSIEQAVAQVLALVPPSRVPARDGPPRRAVLLLCAEQGFAGAFSERMLDRAARDYADAQLLLAGSRGLALARERGIEPVWSSPLPAHPQGVSQLADRVVEALAARLAQGRLDAFDVLLGAWQASGPLRVERRALFPLDARDFEVGGDSPLHQVDATLLLQDLSAAWLHAALCDALLHAFAAENLTRMQTMASAQRRIDGLLASLQATQHQVRQQEITAEILELVAGEAANCDAPAAAP